MLGGLASDQSPQTPLTRVLRFAGVERDVRRGNTVGRSQARALRTALWAATYHRTTMNLSNEDHVPELRQIEAEFRAGRAPSAVARVLAVLDATEDLAARANYAGALIDMGAAAANADWIRSGLGSLDGLRARYGSACPAQVYYNLGNGWDALGRLELQEREWTERWKLESFQDAKACQREARRACESAAVPVKDRLRYLVNHANILDFLGRHLEAIRGYDEALALDRDFGMALCNKGVAAQFFAGASREYGGAVYAWAWQMLKQGLEDPRIDTVGADGARAQFERRMAAIEARVSDSGLLARSLAHPPEDMTGASDFERLYVRLCTAEHLFLNVHIHERACKAATLDYVFIVPPVPMTDEYLAVAKMLLQIIEDFSTSRYVWVLGEYESEEVRRIGGRTRTPRILGAEASLRHGLTKASLRLGFDVLDKIAGFLNDYLDVGVEPTRVTFTRADRHSVWWQDGKNKVLRPVIDENLGSSLAALYDIFLDFQDNSITGRAFYQELKDTRNALTHRRLLVAAGEATGAEEADVDAETLSRRTRQVLFLVRCAIMYLILFVNSREQRMGGERGRSA